MSDKAPRRDCSICGRSFPPRELVPGALVRESVADAIRRDHPEWSGEGDVCREDLSRYRAQAVSARLADRIAAVGGSWTFIFCFFASIVLWMTLNSASIRST